MLPAYHDPRLGREPTVARVAGFCTIALEGRRARLEPSTALLQRHRA
jgi:hypothetical protein